MVTDDERREVARRLRSFVTDDSVYADVDACRVLHSIGLYYKDIDRIYFSGFDVARLADLIEPSEPKVKCVAEVKVDGEQLEKLAHDAAVEYAGVDRDALLALAKELSGDVLVVPAVYGTYQSGYVAACQDIARRIREACGEEGA